MSQPYDFNEYYLLIWAPGKHIPNAIIKKI